MPATTNGADLAKTVADLYAILDPLDPADRRKVVDAAMALCGDRIMLRDLVGGGIQNLENPGVEQGAPDSASLEKFMEGRETAKPSDNVFLAAAYMFSEYGSEPFTVEDLRDVGERAGLTLPRRLDMTVKNAARGGKGLFRPTGRGRYGPTVHGESYLKGAFGVKKGNRKRRPSVAAAADDDPR